MAVPTEHKTVLARILAYAQEIGWTYVSRDEAEVRRGFDPDGALVGEFQRLKTDISGNRDFLTYLRNQGKFFCAEESRELDLILIDYGDLTWAREQWRNVYEVTEEFYVHNGRHGTREDVVFLINGIPVLVVECKNASKDEAIALAVDQLRRYHAETPEVMVPEMIFSATEAIGFAYGATWNTVRRNIFNWKLMEGGFSNPPFKKPQFEKGGLENPPSVGNLEAKIKSFCAVPQVLRLLKDFILFAEKEEELQKFILRQHQMSGVDRVVARALDPRRSRGLVWHTQNSGKTYTMIKASEMLFKAPEAEKPTILLMIDRNELEDQMVKNLASVGLGNVAHAGSIAALNRLLREDYRGIIVTMIHKFRDMPANVNLRKNIHVLIDEAHRTTGGDLGTFLMAGLPNATFIGFTRTPVDKTAYGKGTIGDYEKLENRLTKRKGNL
jgi:type I restriction enzyme R subunit